MKKKKKSLIFDRRFQDFFLVVFLLVSAFLFASAFRGGDAFEIFKLSVQKNVLLGAITFVFLETVSIVIAPVTTIFLIPIASEIFGPLLAAILSVVGWTIGSVIAFLLARRFGRPVLEKIVDPKKLERYRNHISSDAEFLTVIILRIMLPVDVLSYAIGLSTVMRFRKYLLATMIGITPFSFIYAFGGEALIRGDYARVMYIATGALLFLLFMLAIFKGNNRCKKKRT